MSRKMPELWNRQDDPVVRRNYGWGKARRCVTLNPVGILVTFPRQLTLEESNAGSRTVLTGEELATTASS